MGHFNFKINVDDWIQTNSFKLVLRFLCSVLIHVKICSCLAKLKYINFKIKIYKIQIKAIGKKIIINQICFSLFFRGNHSNIMLALGLFHFNAFQDLLTIFSLLFLHIHIFWSPRLKAKCAFNSSLYFFNQTYPCHIFSPYSS